jgi:hypothetical protein
MIHKQTLKNLLFERVEPEAKAKADDITSDELHVFDFDDTIAETADPVGIAIFRDKKPVFWAREHKDRFVKFLSNYLKLKQGKDILPVDGAPDGVKFIPEINNWAAYISSGALAREIHSRGGQGGLDDHSEAFVATPQWNELEKDGEPTGWMQPENLDTDTVNKSKITYALDFSLCTTTTVQNFIPKTLEKMRDVANANADSHVMTARAGQSGNDRPTSELQSFQGQGVSVTNEEDIADALKSQNIAPSKGVWGTTGADKGKEILALVGGEENLPPEVHFYDDGYKNIQKVKAALGGKTDLFLYGPTSSSENGTFNGSKDAYEPDEFIPKEDEDKAPEDISDSIMRRWNVLAGI